MEKRKISEMSNIDLSLYKKELENEFESTKIKIEKMLDELATMDDEYKKIETELNKRQNTSFK